MKCPAVQGHALVRLRDLVLIHNHNLMIIAEAGGIISAVVGKSGGTEGKLEDKRNLKFESCAMADTTFKLNKALVVLDNLAAKIKT